MKFYCQADRNLLHNCVRVLFQFAMLLKESFITSLKLLVVVKGTYMEELRHHDW